MKSKLNILIANWKWHHSAGDFTYIDNLKDLYESKGHRVITFSMKSPKNIETNEFEKYFVSHIDYRDLNKNTTLKNGIKALTRSIFSSEAKRNIENLVADYKIDIAHLHNINHYITPSIFPVLKSLKIPIIWTLHDYTLLCPENSFVSNDKICEKCRNGKFYNCGLQKCKKGSYLASSLAGLENYVHYSSNVFRHIDRFLCPSEFLLKKFTEFNFFPDKLVLTNLCLEFKDLPPHNQREDYILFVGRLEKTKGVLTLLNAVKTLNLPLYIAGDGTQEPEIKKYILDNQLSTVTLLGFKSKVEIQDLLLKATMLVCPSEWYENFPFSVIEAISTKTPVIASAIGGIPELIQHEQTGLLFEPGNASQLEQNILRLWNDRDLQQALAERAYARTSKIVSYETHYQILKNVYSSLELEL